MYNLTKEELARYKQKYRIQKYNATQRVDKLGTPIQFNLTFDQWMDIWMTSGLIEKMGRRRGNYVMSRYNDLGNYELGNIFIQLVEQNVSDGHRGLSKNRGDHSIRKGVQATEETKAKQRDAHRGVKLQKKNTPIMTPAGQFSCIIEAAEYLGITPEAIHYFKRKYPTEWHYIID